MQFFVAESFFKMTVYLIFTVWAFTVSYKDKCASLSFSFSLPMLQVFHAAPGNLQPCLKLQVFDRYSILLAGVHKTALRFFYLTRTLPAVLCRDGLLHSGNPCCLQV